MGLIGGSIALAVKKRRLAGEVIGVFRHRSTMKRALRHKAVDRGALNIKDGVKDSDFIILATPVEYIPEIAKAVIKFAKPGAILTDAGSTKKWIVNKVGGMTRSFAGSHPMAGSEHSGVEFAHADLLVGSPCIVTKTAKTDSKALKKIASFWKALGAKVVIMDPEAHDKAVSFISHLPHVVSFSTALAAPVKALSLAAEGFKDTTRIASSDPELWADIFLTNRNEILKAAVVFKSCYNNILRTLSKNDRPALIQLLKAAKAKRDRLV